MTEYEYYIVDVFTQQRFGGNQLAVFPNADALSDQQMQQIANEIHFSETSFVQSTSHPDADYHVRIFTPDIELPMAGHPSVGTAFLLKHLGRAPADRITFEEGVGLIEMHYTGDTDITIWMTQPLPKFSSTFEDKHILSDLLSLSLADIHSELPAQVVSTGVPFLLVPIQSLDGVRRATFRLDVWEKHIASFETPHVFIFSTETIDPEATAHSRMFAPAMGISEDPATGAASGPLGAYLWQYSLIDAEQAAQIISEQGYEMRRPSQIKVRLALSDNTITGVQVGGSCVYVGHGAIITD